VALAEVKAMALFTLSSELPVLQILALTTFAAKTSNEQHHPRHEWGSLFLSWNFGQHHSIA
tara:strand:+ start:250 stop:432 length:183 start_codon:yes stop_codon:yes gene_type:complete